MRIVRATAFVLSIVVLSYGSTASADIVSNGGFETDLTDWTATGTVDAVGQENPRDGWTSQPVPVSGLWTPAPPSTSFASLWSTGWGGDAATLSQTFTAPAGYVLSFDYFFDFGDDIYHADTAKATLRWSSHEEVLFQHNFGNELSDFENKDWSHVAFVLPTTGGYSLQFEVADVYDPLAEVPAYESILGVDNVSVVPVPGALLLGALGLGSAGGLLRRLRRGTRS